jgi:predicted ATPase
MARDAKGGTAMITRFSVKNYKALRDVTLALTPLHVLIGPNDSGKTSILEALAAICKSVDAEIRNSFPASEDPNRLLWEAGNKAISLAAEISGGSISGIYRLNAAVPEVSGQPWRVENEVWEDHEKPPLNISLRSPPQVSAVKHFKLSGSVAPGTDKNLLLSLHQALSGVVFFRWNPRMLKLPVLLDAQHRFMMDNSGFGLAQCLDDILGLDRERFDRLEQKFCEVFPEIKSVQVSTESAYSWPASHQPDDLPHLGQVSGKGISFLLKNGRSIRAAQASDGLLLILAYITLLHLPQVPRVILVEEPENGIHPARLREVMDMLRQLIDQQDQTQILMTTHSPYLLDLFKPDEVTLCRKGDDGSISLSPLAENQEVARQLAAFNLGEIWTAEGDEALSKPASDEGN